MKLFNTLIRSLLLLLVVACLGVVIGQTDSSLLGSVLLGLIMGLWYFFWHRKKPKGYIPTSFWGKIVEGLLRVARALVFLGAALLMIQPGIQFANLITGITILSSLGYLFWFLFVHKTSEQIQKRQEEEQAAERKRREEKARRGPSFWDKLGMWASTPPSSSGGGGGGSGNKTCPSCGGKGTVRCPLPDAGRGKNCPMCHGKEYIHCTNCGGRGWLY